MSFPFLLMTEGRCYGVDGCSLSNADDFELDIALSPLSFSSSSTMMHHVSDCLSLRHLKIFTAQDGT